MREQIAILSVPIDVVTKEQAVDKILGMMDKPGFHLVATVNAEMIMLAQKHSDFMALLKQAAMVVPDGAGALWAAEQMGKRFPERVTGVDLAVALFEKAAESHIPVYLLGAAPGVLEKAAENMEKQFGKLDIVGMRDGYFTPEEEAQIALDIQRSGAKLVLVALGVPRQEFWMQEHLGQMHGIVGIGLGGTFDVLSGSISRAPEWMQKNRLEWLYRLYKEPKRFIRMLAIPQFMWTVWRSK